MKMWIQRLLLLIVLMLMLNLSLVYGETEEEIPLSEVPAKILEAAEKAVPGIEFTEAEIEKTDDGVIYELEGILNEERYEIEISAEGKVLEVELEDEDDADNNSDDDNDDDDD
jgi:hypothetical protein